VEAEVVGLRASTNLTLVGETELNGSGLGVYEHSMASKAANDLFVNLE
jgi:hypothetical protein